MKKNDFIDLDILNFGELKRNFYQNSLIDWHFSIPKNFKVKLKSEQERKDIYAKSVSGILLNSTDEINSTLSWTDLIELESKTKKTYFYSAIRRVKKNEKWVIQESLEQQVISFTEPWFFDQNFGYQFGKIDLGQINFDYVEFSEIKYTKGNNFCLPFIKLLGIKNDLLIRFVISYENKKDMKNLLDLIEIKE